MKSKVVKTLLSVSVAASMALTVPSAAWASQADAETASEETAEEEPQDIAVALEEGNLTITNQTTRTFTEAQLKEEAAQETDASKEAAQDTAETADVEETEAVQEADNAEAAEDAAAGTKEEPSVSLVITEENGDIHTFSQVNVETWTDPVLFDEYGFLYIRYNDADGSTKEVAETAEEKEFEGAVTMYASSNVHIREKADQESESLKVLQLGDEVIGTGAVPGWIKVESGDVTGYVYHSYVTENKESVDALVQAKKEAEEAAAAQAAAEAAAAAQAAADAAAAQAAADAAAQQPQESEVYEVSRQKFDDCDGSGHGYYEITYSDGSVAYEEY